MWLKLKNRGGAEVFINLAPAISVTHVPAGRSGACEEAHWFVEFAGEEGAYQRISDPDSMARLTAALDWHAAQAQASLSRPVALDAYWGLVKAAEGYIGADRADTQAALDRLEVALKRAREALKP